jgi:hypothetical protein
MRNFILRDVQVLDDRIDYILWADFTSDEIEKNALIAPTLWITVHAETTEIDYILCDEGVPVHGYTIRNMIMKYIQSYLDKAVPTWKAWVPGAVVPEKLFDVKPATDIYFQGSELFKNEEIWGVYDERRKEWAVRSVLTFYEAYQSMRNLLQIEV